MFYFLSVSALLVVLPVLAHFVFSFDLLTSFVFFASVRLFLAGIMQINTPNFTAESIFGLAGERLNGAIPVVRELGFSNFAVGVLGVVAPFIRRDFVVAAALVGGLYYFLAGVGHLFLHGSNRNSQRTFAMVTDFFIAIAMLLSWAARK